MKRTQKQIDNILKKIVLTKKQGANGGALKELYKLRYGKEWSKYYPAS